MRFVSSDDITLTKPRKGKGRARSIATNGARFHQYSGAMTGRDRSPPRPLRSPDSPMAQSDALQMQRRAHDQGNDNAFIAYLVSQYKTYGWGDLQYIPNTGNRGSNQKYRDYWQQWMENADAQGRFHFIDLLQLAIAGVIYNGRHGLIHHHNPDGTFQVQSVMGYNIGNPRAIYVNPQHISGTVLDEAGRVVAYDLYRLGINGTVHFVQRVPAAIFSCLNPVASTDEIAAKTPLHAILNDAHDMKDVENAWLQKTKWAAFKTAVFNTPNGSPPDADPDANELDGYGLSPAHGKTRHMLPGEEMHGEEGFSVEVLRNETPSSNEMELLLVKLQQIAMALKLPLPFVWVMMGLPGTYTRLISEQAQRSFQHGPLGQKWVERVALNSIKKMALLSGIIRGDIPHEDAWNRGAFMYPAHPTVDAGNDSAAKLAENRQGITSMAEIASAKGRHWEDVDEELAAEALNKMVKAAETSQNFNRLTGEKTTWHDAIGYIQAMSPNPPPPAKTAPDAGEVEEKPVAKGAAPSQTEAPPAEEGESKFTRLEAKLDSLGDLVARFASGWEESKHDRAEDGKFAPESGGDKAENAHAKVRGIFDNYEALKGMSQAEVESALDSVLDEVTAADMRKVATKFVGSGMAGMTRQQVRDQIASKILTKHGHITSKEFHSAASSSRLASGWEESKHDRADDGKFAPEGGGGSGGEKKASDPPPLYSKWTPRGRSLKEKVLSPKSDEDYGGEKFRVWFEQASESQLRNYVKTQMGSKLPKIKDEKVLRMVATAHHLTELALGATAVETQVNTAPAKPRKAPDPQKLRKTQDSARELETLLVSPTSSQQLRDAVPAIQGALKKADAATLRETIRRMGRKPASTKAGNLKMIQAWVAIGVNLQKQAP